MQATITQILSQGVSQNQLATRIGISPATIIAIRNDDWSKISTRMFNKLMAYFNIDNWNIRRTTNFNKIFDVCQDAKLNKRMLAISGYTGSGKTTALRKYATSHPEVYYVLATSIMTKRSFLREIQRSMGIQEGTSIQDMMSSITSVMNQAENALLIIDDAGKLSEVILRLIQIIYDSTEYRAGIILAGTEYLKEMIDKLARKNRMGFRELKRRIAFWQPMYRPTRKVVETICTDNDITDTNAIRYIYDNAHDYGTLRNLITNALRIRNTKAISVNREILESLHVGEHFYNQTTIPA